MRWLLDYASQESSGYAVWERDTDHIEKGFVFAGMPARNGVTAALLVLSGFNGVDDVFSGDDNYFQAYSPKGNPALLATSSANDSPSPTPTSRSGRSARPSRRHSTPLKTCEKKRPFEADQVKAVVVRLAPTVGAVVDNRDIPDISLQHMIAVMLLDKTASFHAAHDKARMQDAAVLRQRAKVQYVPDEQLARLLPCA
jgi:2-methylcitrate dehydratase PrpD